MKKVISLILLVTLLFSNFTYAEAAKIWSKYVAKDKSFSFHYPSGWKVTEGESVIVIENAKSKEQLMMVMLPFEEKKTPKQHASGFISMVKSENPNIKASNWRSLTGTKDDHIVFDLSDKINGKKQLGLGLLIKDKSSKQAIWFSYFAPEADYYLIRGYGILEGFLGSIASGSSSTAPKIDYTVDVGANIDKNAKGFLFILEFALGAPFTKSQEDTILKELKAGWRHLSKEELAFYDEYPVLAKSIMKAKQKDIEKIRKSFEEIIKEIIDESDQKDPAIKIIKSTMENRGKIVVKGDPPLTEMSLQAYSEIIAYSMLLQEDDKASPDKITKKSVDSIKKQVKKVWKDFSKEDKEDIATAPGVWFCLRAQYRFGTKAQQKEIRNSIKKIEQAKAVVKDDKGTASTGKDKTNVAMDMTAHMSMMQIQQMTFNTYMWSRGFNYLPATGKMW